MVDKYIGIDGSGNEAEVPFKQTSAGSADAGKGIALGADGKIDDSMLPEDVTNSVVSFENMTAPCLVNLFNSSGTTKARYADASAASQAKKVDGFIKDTVVAPAAVNVYTGRGAIIPGFSGLTPDADYFLSGTTPGGITATPVTTSGYALQKVGKAYSATELIFNPEPPITRA